MSEPAHDDIRAATIEVRYDPEAERFDALFQGRPTGAVLHAPRGDDGVWDLRSTQVPGELEGRGIAGALVRAALERVAENEGDRVRPSCSYVGTWLRRHPEWMELVHPRFRAWLEPRASSGPDEDGVGGDDDGGADGSAGDGGGMDGG
jgi:predicted GNAT family acetyltransferase